MSLARPRLVAVVGLWSLRSVAQWVIEDGDGCVPGEPVGAERGRLGLRLVGVVSTLGTVALGIGWLLSHGGLLCLERENTGLRALG